MFNKLSENLDKFYDNLKNVINTSSIKTFLSILVFGISLGIGTNKLFGYLVTRYTEPQFGDVINYEKLTDKKIDSDEHDNEIKFKEVQQNIHDLDQNITNMNISIGQLLGKIDVLSNQLDAVSSQTYQSYKLSRKLVKEKSTTIPARSQFNNR